MKLKTWLEKWKLETLRINVGILETRINFADADKNAAWELYVELITRITTQPLSDDQGVEVAALSSIHKLFDITRDVLKRNGRGCIEFTRIAVVVLNQIIRPFTAKWHRLSELNAFSKEAYRQEFRQELSVMQQHLINYSHLLADMAGVEDLSFLES